jgi:Tfp pilus assembly protein PilF
MNRITLLLTLPLLLLVLLVGYLVADWYHAAPKDAVKNYIGRSSCAECHQQQVQQFLGSHHDKAMDVASDQTVLGNFDDQAIEHFGIESRMFRDGDRYLIHTEGPDGTMADFEIKYVFGFTPLQQYMVELAPAVGSEPNAIGRVQVLRVSWDTQNERWFYLSPPDVNEKLDPDDPLHWTGITQNWNTSCAECHSTGLKKNYQVTTNQYHTTFSEIDVSCEACHGPASLHVELANQKSLFWDRNHGFGLAKLKSLSNVPQVQSCAPCHSRRSVVQEGFQAGCNFDDYYALQTLSYPIYHVDGQIRDEDYVYGSFLQSKMYHNGIRCSDCHDPHTAKLIHTGNQVCTSCHQHSGGKYDSPNHHHHKMGTAGAACVNCHMATTHYMELDGRRDHSFRVPDPALSVQTATPNACTACHLEFESNLPVETAADLKQYLDHIIAAENGNDEVKQNLQRIDASMLAACEKWYPLSHSKDGKDKDGTKTEYYQKLAVGQSERSLDRLWELFRDKRNPELIRASAVESMLQLHPDVDAVLEMLRDRDVMVRVAALDLAEEYLITRANDRSSWSDGDFKRVLSAIVDRLKDASVRVAGESAWVISMLPEELRQARMSSEDSRAFERSLQLFEKSLDANRDRASSHLMRAGLFERQNQPQKAIQAYRNAMSVQPTMVGPRSNLAVLLEQQAQQLASGQAQFQTPNVSERIKRLVNQAEQLRRDEHQNLKRDVERAKDLPNTDGLNYRYGMSSYLQGDYLTAEQQLELALKKAPESETYLLGLATFYFQLQKFDQALPLAKQLVRMSPENEQFQSLLNAIKQASR